MTRWETHFWYQRRLGFLCGLRWSLANAADRRGLVHKAVPLRPSCLRHPVLVRMGQSSDRDLFRDIFIDGGMDFWRTNMGRSPQVIVDLGANVGFTSSFFLSLFPGAFVLAVEPDPANFEICKRTLARYGNRAKVVEGAAWHSCGQLALSRGTFFDGREWATQVCPTARGVTGSVTAFDMPALLAMCPRNEIDILKIDIEGSEKALFSENTGEWLPHVHNICIETHGTDCAEAVATALAPYRRRTGQTGEYRLYLDISA
ncbi:MAG: FkbM family methyltransferase [Terracidiphilus sp.]|jgi:FkbM family methyltransferase